MAKGRGQGQGTNSFIPLVYLEALQKFEIVQGLLGLESISLARGKAVNYHDQSVHSFKKVKLLLG